MKLPDKFTGRNRIRDYAICVLWDREDMPTDKLAEKFNLTQRRIEQILRTNHAFVPIDKEWEKRKRISKLKGMLIKYPAFLGKKSTIDILEQMRKEIEGDKPLIDNRITNVVVSVKEKSAEDIRAGHRITSEPI